MRLQKNSIVSVCNKLFRNQVTINTINKILKEYFYLVYRFPQWFALTIALTEDELIRKLLLPNLIDETGDLNNNPSHLKLLRNLLESCDVDYQNYNSSQKTIEIENWFYTLFASGDTYKKLCVLGPATEEISQSFLVPLENAIRQVYTDKNVDYSYFDAHRSEVEAHHAADLNKAIRHYENYYLNIPEAEIDNIREKYASEGITKHIEFWTNLSGSI